MTLLCPQWFSVVSGGFGIVPAYNWMKSIPIIGLVTYSSTFFTIIQHVTEKLPGYKPLLNIGRFYRYFLWFDRLSAVLLGCMLIYYLQEKTIRPKIILFSGLALIVVCDSGIIEDSLLYSIVHSTWHILVWTYLSRMHELYIEFDLT